MSNTQEDKWDSKEETSNGLFVKIAANSEVRLRFVGPLFRRMEQFKDQEPKVRFYSRCILRTKVENKAVNEAKVFGFGTMIKNMLADLALDEDWGNPEHYDVVVKRTGEGMDTKYAVVPKQPSKLDGALHAEAMAIDLEAVLEKGSSAPKSEPTAPVPSDTGYDPFADD